MKAIKLFFIISLIFFSFPVISQNKDTFGHIQIKFYNKTDRKTIQLKECKATLIINKDTIVTQPDSIYKIPYPVKNSRMIVQFKGYYQLIKKSDEYLNEILLLKDTVYVGIYLHSENKNGNYFIQCFDNYSFGGFYGIHPKKELYQFIIFAGKPETLFKEIR